MRRFLTRFRKDQRGATALEYGLIVALIFLVILSALTAFGSAGSGVINRAMEALSTAMGGGS